MSPSFRSLITLFCFCGSLVNAIGQDILATNWYFGNSEAAIVFDKSGREPNLKTHQGTPFGMGGSAVISNQLTGNLLFYSDGERVYDSSHELVPAVAGGTFLNGDPSLSQPVVAAPLPDNSGQYYLFTNNGASIEYSLVDPSIQGNSAVPEFPMGDVVTFNQPTGLTNPSEGMTVLEGADRQRFWLITQDRNSFEFRVTEITAAGVGSTTNYSVFPDTSPGYEAVQFAVNEDTVSSIAVAPKSANRNVMIMDFDPATGELTFNRLIQNSGFPDGGPTVISDVEWSPDGTKLYLSRTGDETNPGTLYQVDFADTVNTSPRPVNELLPYSFFRSYGLKRAIDGNIYHLYQLDNAASPYRLGRINTPDSVVENITYDSLVFDEDFNGQQFPEFAPPYLPNNFFDMSFTYLDSCYGNTTKFIALVDPLPHNFFWDFGDGSFGAGPAPIHEYEAEGGYFATLFVELNGIVQATTLPLDILASDSVDLGNDTTICVNEVLPLDAGEGVSWLWSTGEMTQTIEVDTAGTYWVEKTNAQGCTSFDDIVVTEYGVQRQISNQWYFGDRAGLDFTNQPPQALTDGEMVTPEGCATISDVDGKLLFYTNGRTVWNKEHDVMVNGDSLGGDSTAAQSALILPFQEDQTMFYIFTTEEVYGDDFRFQMKMSIVDMKYDTARGKVTAKNIPIIENSTERITATGFDGNPWLMAREYGNYEFRGYPISDNGIGQAVYSASGELHSFQIEENATGYMKFSPSTNYLAVVIPGDSNRVNILDFDANTGAVRNSRVINIDEPAPALIYGLEFSGDDQKLYVTTVNGASSKLIQYDLDSINADNPADYIEATKYDQYPVTLSDYGALQMGPDGRIYLAIDGAPAVGTISSPGGDDDAAGFNEQDVSLDGRSSLLGLPNFTQQLGSSLQEPNISVDVACAGQPATFSGQGRDSSIETYRWRFGDPDSTQTGFLSSPDTSFTYTQPGTYTVELTLRNRCDQDTTLFQTIEVFSIPEQPMVPEDTALCGGSVTLAAWDVDRDDLNYYWSTGDTTRTVTFTMDDLPDGSIAGLLIDVAIINDDGCSSDTLQVLIGENERPVEIGPDRIFCQYDTTAVLDANDPGPDYVWRRNGQIVGNQRRQSVNTDSPGEFTYSVAIENPFSGCVYTDTVTVTIQPGPEVEQTNVVLPECGEPTGSFELSINSTGNYSYELSGPVSAGPFNIDGPGNTPPFTGLPSGSYVATVTNTVTGCANPMVVPLEDNAPFDLNAVSVNECARNSDISLNFVNDVPVAVDINVRDRYGSNVYSTTQNLSTRNVLINDLDTGTYFIEVRDVNPPNCIQTDTVHLAVSQECYRSIFIPTAFSPGSGTGLNEEFYAFPNQYIEDFQIYIFNKWGDLIYYSTDKNFRWDGTYNGSLVAPGKYAVRMVYTSSLEPDLGAIEQYSSVTVVR